MSCDCNDDRVELIMKQGEQRSFIFNIKDKDQVPVDLEGATIEVQIKNYPLFKVKSLFEVTLDEATSEFGYINDPSNGQFTLTLTEDISGNLPPKEYYLIITLVRGDGRTIISGEGEQSGILTICRQ